MRIKYWYKSTNTDTYKSTSTDTWYLFIYTYTYVHTHMYKSRRHMIWFPPHDCWVALIWPYQISDCSIFVYSFHCILSDLNALCVCHLFVHVCWLLCICTPTRALSHLLQKDWMQDVSELLSMWLQTGEMFREVCISNVNFHFKRSKFDPQITLVGNIHEYFEHHFNLY